MNDFPFPPLGELVGIGGYRLHARKMGTGAPAVVMDAGLGATSLLYELVLPRIAEFTTAVSFDRAGYAWSDPAPAHLSRTSEQLVEEQRALQKTLNLVPPFVLVGNSFGAINNLVYANLYPDEVAGFVLIDPSHPEMFERLPNVPSSKTVARMAQMMKVVAKLKLARLLANASKGTMVPGWRNLPPSVMAIQEAFSGQASMYEAWRREAADGDESFRQARDGGYSLGDKPFIVLTAGEFWATPGSQMGRPEAMKKAMLQMREEMAKHSSRGIHRIVEGASHTMQVDHPEAVVEAVREVIEMARAGQAAPAGQIT
jgi:pimeloyl-ACP methyl ester carboxylesterase